MCCDHFDADICHSYSLLPQSYERQFAEKIDAVVTALAHVPGTQKIWRLGSASSPEEGFRTSVKLMAGGSRRRPTLGLLGPDRRSVDLPGCPIQYPAINHVTPGLKRFIRALGLTPHDVSTKHGELRDTLTTVGAEGRFVVRFVLRTRERVSDICSVLPLLHDLVPSAHVVTANIHPTHETIVEGPDEIILARTRTLPLSVEGLESEPRSFVQTNAHVASTPYEQTSVWASRPFTDGRLPESLWDLYCGVGGFALACARSGLPHVTGVEVSPGTISFVISAARHVGLSRGAATFTANDTTAQVRAQSPEDMPDVIVVNSLRRGIRADLATYLNGCVVSHTICSSCNPMSLVRDLQPMPSLRPVEGRIFDMFPHTTHVEVTLLLERERAQRKDYCSAGPPRGRTPSPLLGTGRTHTSHTTNALTRNDTAPERLVSMRTEHVAMYTNDLEVMRDFFVRYLGGCSNDGHHNTITGLRSYLITFEEGPRLEVVMKSCMDDTVRGINRTRYAHIAFPVGSEEAVNELATIFHAGGYEVLSGPRTAGDGYYEGCVMAVEGNQAEITV